MNNYQFDIMERCDFMPLTAELASLPFVEIPNIAIERCFRHIAMGRRNWGKAGSHEAAENLAFMYSLYESWLSNCRVQLIFCKTIIK